MTDGRNFTWSAEAEDRVGDFIDDGIYAERFVGAIADDILNYLGKIVKDELAAEYDRGYKTALDMEVDSSPRTCNENALCIFAHGSQPYCSCKGVGGHGGPHICSHTES